MVEEAGTIQFLHAWGCKVLTEAGHVKGVIFESKSGRKADLGKVIIGSTGDGDIMASVGAKFEGGVPLADKLIKNSSLRN